ncbi:LysR family transcriptional regulator, partial [Actinomadura sp. NPDC049753]|uniref:LysR family transcriptional regulator n=1 Tax=Actinomadura sp. NPDC049753 TaxID=3154739 RepID=UPI0034416C35
MTEARLRALVALADTGSVRSAARRLYVTESAVSAAVAALTRELGVPLVSREGRGVRLTGAGAVYAGYARQVLGLLEEGRAAARGAADPGMLRPWRTQHRQRVHRDRRRTERRRRRPLREHHHD